MLAGMTEPGEPTSLGELEPIERASVDELRALQLERLRWSLRHAYENVPHHRAAFEAAGVHPDDLCDRMDLPAGLPQQPATHPSPCRMARLLQHSPAPQRARRPTTDQPPATNLMTGYT
jgi:hypothetical protein